MDTNTINCMHEKIVVEDMPSDLGSGKVRVWNCDICGVPFFPDGHFARQHQSIKDAERERCAKIAEEHMPGAKTLIEIVFHADAEAGWYEPGETEYAINVGAVTDFLELYGVVGLVAIEDTIDEIKKKIADCLPEALNSPRKKRNSHGR